MTIKTRRKLLWLSILLFLLAAPPIVLYSTGWRLTSDFKIKRVGGLFIAVPEAGAVFYLDGRPIKNTNFLQSGVFIQELTPGAHSIMVSKDGFWPWTKKLEVAESAVAEAKAFMLPQNINGKILLNGPFETIYASDKNNLLVLEERKGEAYALTFYLPETNEFLSPINSSSKKLLTNQEKLKTLMWKENGADIFFSNKTLSLNFDFSKGSLSAKKSSLKLDESLNTLPHKVSLDYRQKAEMRFDDKSVRIKWLATTLPYFLDFSEEVIFQSKSQVRSAAFFPKKSDLAIIAYENGVFTLELDGRSARNFQPIYKGKNPYFAILNNKIYVLDQNILALMEL